MGIRPYLRLLSGPQSWCPKGRHLSHNSDHSSMLTQATFRALVQSPSLRQLWSRVTDMSQVRPQRPRFRIDRTKVTWQVGGRTEKPGLPTRYRMTRAAGGQRKVDTKAWTALPLLPASRPPRFPRPQNEVHLLDPASIPWGPKDISATAVRPLPLAPSSATPTRQGTQSCFPQFLGTARTMT